MRHDSAAHAHEGSTVLDYVRILRRRKWIVLVAVILVPLAAVAWSVRQEPVYVATADVWLSNQDISGGVTGFSPNTVYRTPERNAQTQAELAMTPVVAENTLAATGIDSMTPTELLGSVSVVPALDSDLLSVSVTNTDPELAQRLAEAYAREFTEYKENFDTVAIRRALADVEAQLRELEARGESTDRLVRLASRVPADAPDDGGRLRRKARSSSAHRLERFRSLRSPSGTASSGSCSGSFSA